jgi:hypothetical protein
VREPVPAGKLGLHFSQRPRFRIGVLAVSKLAAAFQDADLLSPRQPRRGDSAPETGACDQNRGRILMPVDKSNVSRMLYP